MNIGHFLHPDHLMPTPTHEWRMALKYNFEMDEDTVISLNWSIHSGVGTMPYAFIWAMAGESQQLNDMDFFDMRDLR